MSNNSWMTPMWVLLKVHNVMGGIDLDPASCAEANKKVEAKRFFDGTQVDALTISYWSTYPETIYLNPPGGKKNNIPVARIFWTKLMQHLDKGLV
ncbi:MAG: hypothetical protein ACRDEA_17005, partial [Microcystaceae cyanobacterium]